MAMAPPLTLTLPGVLSAVGVLVRVLDQRDRFDAAADGNGHAVGDDLPGGDRDRHQPGAALPSTVMPGTVTGRVAVSMPASATV